MNGFNYNEEDYIYFIFSTVVYYILLIGTSVLEKKKERQLLEKEGEEQIAQEKTRIAVEMHDDIGADLSNLLFKLRIYQNANGIKNIDEYHQIESFTKEIIKKVNETIWTLNGEKDNLISLNNFLLKYLDEFLSNSDINYRFIKTSSLDEVPITIEIRRNIFYLFKESIHYVCLFSGLNDLEVKIDYLENNIIIIIIDNALRQENELTKYQSLFILIENRITLLKGKMELKTQAGKYNELIFTVNLQKQTFQETHND